MRLIFAGVLCVVCLTMALGLSCAAETVVVKPSNLSQAGWTIVQREGAVNNEADGSVGPGKAVAEFVSGYETAPSGSGSLHLYVGRGANDPLPKVYAGTNKYSGVRLDKITQFKLWVCPFAWDLCGAQPVSVEIATTQNNNLRLCTFYPWGCEPTGYYGRRVWREVDLLSSDGSWKVTNIDSKHSEGNWKWLVSRHPSSTIISPAKTDWPDGTLPGTGINIKIGAGKAVEPNHCDGAWWKESSGCNAYVDKLTIGYLDETGNEVVTTYDFEAE